MKNIIVIEDDPIIRKIYTNHLEKAGYHVDIAADGEAGWQAIQATQPDGVLLDLMMPRMSGIEVLKQIRSHPTMSKTPVIVFTNAHVPMLVDSAVKEGATWVFNKATAPPQSVLKALHDALGNDRTT